MKIFQSHQNEAILIAFIFLTLILLIQLYYSYSKYNKLTSGIDIFIDFQCSYTPKVYLRCHQKEVRGDL